MLDFQKIHEILVELLMHELPDFSSQMFELGVIEFFEGVDFFSLELIQVLVDERTFNCISLRFISRLVVVLLDGLSFLVVVIVEVPHAVTECALLAAEDAEASEVEAAEGFLGGRLILFHENIIL